MAVYSGSANSVLELVQGVLTFLTDESVFGAGNAWKLLRPSTIAQINADDPTNKIILQGTGDGTECIYLGIKITPLTTIQAINLQFTGFAGYDPYLEFEEQPGILTHNTLPCMPLVDDTFMSYWIVANTRRIIIVVQFSTQYEACYLGFFTPVSISRQYPYPMVLGGSYSGNGLWTSTSAGHSMFFNPGADDGSEVNSALRIRRPDGTWRGGLNKNASFISLPNQNLNVWPTNTDPVRTLTVLDDTLTLENVIMFPMLMYENNPNGLIGQLDGVFWIGNREDISSKDNIVYDGKVYKVFNNVFRRDSDSYFAIEWA